MSEASRDGNFVTTLLAVSSVDGVTPVTLYANPTTHRLLVDLAGGGSGTVTTVSVVSANGFAGTVATATTTPAITLTTSVTGILKGNGTAISAITVGSGLSYDGTTLSATGGTGDVVGPASATDNAVARFNTTTGKLIQNSAVLIADTTGVISGTQGVTFTGATSGTTALIPTAIAAGTQTLPATTGTLVNRVTTANGVSASNTDGALSFTLGAITPTTVNGNTFTTGSSTYTGTAGQTYTFPSTTATLARIDAANTFVGASTASAWVLTSPTITTSIVPTADDGAALGNATTNRFSDLFLAEGGVINWDNGDATMTQTGNDITFAGITTFGVGTSTAVTLGTIELGAASDTTISRASAGVAAIEGNNIVVNTSSPTLATITTTGNIELGNASDTTLSRSSAGVLAVEVVVIPSISSTNTLTNKRITPRVGSTTSSATPTINTDNVDAYHLTAQTADITSFTTNLSGTPTDFQQLRIAVTGTAARAITWGSAFANGPVALPTTTITTTRLDVLFQYDTVTSKWRCMASGSTV